MYIYLCGSNAPRSPSVLRTSLRRDHGVFAELVTSKLNDQGNN